MKVYDLFVTQRLRSAAPVATAVQITYATNTIFCQKRNR